MKKGLGSELCVVCEGKISRAESIAIYLPSHLTEGFKLESELEYGIRGHKACYLSIGTFIQKERGTISCAEADCAHWSAQWIAPGEVGIHCFKLNYEDLVGPGYASSYPVCSFLEPRNPRYKKVQEEMNSGLEVGYSRILEMLKKSQLIKKLSPEDKKKPAKSKDSLEQCIELLKKEHPDISESEIEKIRKVLSKKPAGYNHDDMRIKGCFGTLPKIVTTK